MPSAYYGPSVASSAGITQSNEKMKHSTSRVHNIQRLYQQPLKLTNFEVLQNGPFFFQGGKYVFYIGRLQRQRFRFNRLIKLPGENIVAGTRDEQFFVGITAPE